MKLLLLKTLLQRRARDEGFTLPMVIALGLVMLLLGAVSITIANEENITAITQNSRSDALAIAEIGVAQYREMLDRNRNLTIYNRAQWTSNNVGGVNVVGQNCNVISGTGNGWASNEPVNTAFNAANWRAVNLNETIVGKDLNNDGDSTDTAATIGWYKIVDYEYDNDKTLGDGDDNGNNFSLSSDANKSDDPLPNPPGPQVPVNSITDENDLDDDGQSDTRGILTVKGRTPDGSEAQIEVEIPIRINPGDMTNLAPALWISNTSSTLGNLTIGNGGKVVIKDQASTADGCRDFSDNTAFPGLATGTRPVISDSRDLPPITKIFNPTAPTKPGDVEKTRAVLKAGGGTEDRTNDIPTVTPAVPATPATGTSPAISAIPAKILFGTNTITDKPYNADFKPEPTREFFDASIDCANIKDCRYYYDSPLTTPLTDTDLLTDGIAKTTLLLTQDLVINATGEDVKIGSTSPVANASNTFEIYVNGDRDIIINATQDVTINAFIHAPDSTLTINGTGIVTINGSVWVNDFVNNRTSTTAVTTISPDDINTSASASDKSYKFYRTTNSRTPKPLTGSPTNWKTEEVN